MSSADYTSNAALFYEKPIRTTRLNSQQICGLYDIRRTETFSASHYHSTIPLHHKTTFSHPIYILWDVIGEQSKPLLPLTIPVPSTHKYSTILRIIQRISFHYTFPNVFIIYPSTNNTTSPQTFANNRERIFKRKHQ